MFYGVWHNYTEWVHPREPFLMQTNSIPHIASITDTDVDASFVGDVDTMGLLNDIFGIYNEGNVKNNNDNTWDVLDPMHGVNDEFIDERNCNAAMNNRENYEDAGYRRIIDQDEQEQYPGSNYSKLSFVLHLLHLESMHGWPIKSFDILLQILLIVFP